VGLPYRHVEAFFGATCILNTRTWPGSPGSIITIPFDLLTMMPAKLATWVNPVVVNPPVLTYGNHVGALAEPRFVVHYFFSCLAMTRTGAATDPFATLYFLTGELTAGVPTCDHLEHTVPLMGVPAPIQNGEGFALQGNGQSGSFGLHGRYLCVALGSAGNAPTNFVCNVNVRAA
jgi:hypothetical protein